MDGAGVGGLQSRARGTGTLPRALHRASGLAAPYAAAAAADVSLLGRFTHAPPVQPARAGFQSARNEAGRSTARVEWHLSGSRADEAANRGALPALGDSYATSTNGHRGANRRRGGTGDFLCVRARRSTRRAARLYRHPGGALPARRRSAYGRTRTASAADPARGARY